MSQGAQLIQNLLPGIGTEVISFIAGASTTFLAAEYRERRRRKGEAENRKAKKAQEQQEALEDWHEETQSILTHGVYLVRQAQRRPDFQYEQVMLDIADLYKRLIDKIRPHPDGVPDSTIKILEGVIDIYEKGKLVTEVGDQKEGLEMAAKLFEMGQMEFTESDVDIMSTMEEAGELSEPFQEFIDLIDDAGVSQQEFAGTIGDMFEDWETDDFVFMMAMVADSKEDLDATIELSVRHLLNIIQSISMGAYEVLEDQKTEVVDGNTG